MVGIDARNKNILDTKYICPSCSFILRDPIQLTQCGHRYCQTCLNIGQETTMNCQQCETETLPINIQLDRGFKNDMKLLSIDCSFCQWTGILKNYQEHLDQSHTNIKCDYCGEQFNLVIKFNQHKIFECEQLIVDCLLKDFGCNEQVIRAKMKYHYLTKQHQHAILNFVRQMLSQLHIDHSRTTTTEVVNPVTAQLEELYKMLNMLLDGIRTLINDELCLSNELLQTLTEKSKVNLSIEESNVFLDEAKHNQYSSLLQENINDLQYVSYDGTFIWKITNFREKMISSGEHNHLLEPEELEIKQFRQNLKERVISETSPISKIYDEQISKAHLSPDVLASLPLAHEMQPALCYARRKLTPTLPTSFAFDIPDCYQSTSTGEKFLFSDSLVRRRDRMLLFGSTKQLEILFDSSTVLMDGTFSATPPFFSQVFTLHGLKFGCSFPCVFGLLPDRKKGTYQHLFCELKNVAATMNRVFKPEKIISDFETGLIPAVAAEVI
ncbi:unnamed protein product [Rotaria sp. Silwood1]|nr:unnamed protein product [Rotaria sp. Silwood1]CAF1682779.1 unnamed protein product [Rotaria sp. Silwood1]CAF1685691.1 unnamed protein product [Rotaria sp. Silwood1]CAF3627211.1 unnamed protein product [Rotaria sp. Silwood1]CAF3654998.1 unnamed protein product [Rotaria sp. Silwood1]